MDFSQIALLFVFAAVAGVLSKFVKQPLLVGYLFAGFVLAQAGLLPDSEALEGLSKIGIALLLFLVGLEMNISESPAIGKVALLTGLGQIIFTAVFGFILASILGFGVLPAVYIAIALTFSSTIIIIKLLTEKNDIDSLYGKISVGLLLVQDLVVVLILMFLAGFQEGTFGLQTYLWIIVKALVLIVAMIVLSKKILPKLFERVVNQSTELIFIVGVAWALGVAAFVGGPLGFSLEIGGFFAGLALSNLPDHLQISTRTRPLRDFFLTIFFLLLGTNLVIDKVGAIIVPAVIFSVFVLIGKPIFVLILMGLMGYRKRTNFLASITVAQISEFSLILMAMGLTVGHIGEKEVTTVILVGVFTMTLSTYLILGADKIYTKIEKLLKIFERKKTHEINFENKIASKDHVVLVGSHRTGMSLISLFKKKKIDFVVVDFNPSVASALALAATPVVFGDITDTDILVAANVVSAKLIISTIPDFHDNLTLLSYLKSQKSAASTILRAHSNHEAITLYQKGASFVIVPEIVAGEYIRHVVKSHGISKKRIEKFGKSNLKRLQKIA